MEALYGDAICPQIAGLYLPSQDRFVAVEAWREFLPMILAHEYQHALQDQHFDLERIDLLLRENEDRALAFHAVVEGEAQFVSERCMPLLVERGVVPRVPGAGDLYRMATAAWAGAGVPGFFQEFALVAYGGCASLAGRVHARDGWEGLDRLLREPPASTEQILHPEKLESGEPPVEVALPEGLAEAFGEAWTALHGNVLGELMLRSVLRGMGADAVRALRASSGWGGDRYLVLESEDGRLAWVGCFVWDTEGDAAEWLDAVERAGMPREEPEGTPSAEGPALCSGGAGRRTWIVSGAPDGAPADSMRVLLDRWASGDTPG